MTVQPQTTQSPRRVPFLDEARGLLLFIMVLYHCIYDLISIFGVRSPLLHSPFLHNVVQPWSAGGFILISGIVCRYSRNNLKRGLQTFGVGLGITLLTAVALPSQIVRFGVLHMLGCCMILYALLRPLHKFGSSSAAIAGIAVCILLFLLTRHIARGYLGAASLRFPLPDAWYQSSLLFPLGIHPRSFFSSDYFPLLPWMFVFFAGSFLGIFFVNNALPEFFYRSHSKVLSWVGRHSLIIYILHQPVIYGALLLWFRLVPPT